MVGYLKMKELKFRAIIPERNATIYFTLRDLIQDTFSNREILWEWLEEGHRPDLFTGAEDKYGKDIYEKDIVRYSDGYTAVVVWKDTGFGLEFIEQVENPRTWYYLPKGNVLEILGNIYEHPELIVLLSDDG